MKTIKTIALILLTCSVANSQDAMFSHFFSSPMQMNPALAGDADYARAATQNRVQWPALDTKYYTSVVSYDLNMVRYNSGLGIEAMIDQNTFRTTSVNAYYSYSLQINREWYAKGGLSASIFNRRYTSGELKYVNQYNDYGYTGQSSGESFIDEQRLYPSLGLGAVVYNRSVWGGFSVHHLNMPNISLLENGEARMPTRVSVHGGAHITFDEHKLPKRLIDRTGNVQPVSGFYPYLSYTYQGRFHILDVGSSVYVFPILLGAGVRTNPIYVNDDDYSRNNGIYFSAGFKNERFLAMYSFDAPVNNYINRAAGAHEVSFIYQINYSGRLIGGGAIDLVPIPTNVFF